jgi:hypothetical protein
MNKIPKKYLVGIIVTVLVAVLSFIFLEHRIDKTQFLWAIFNFVLLLVAIAILFKATKLIRVKWGYFTAVIVFFWGLTILFSPRKAETRETKTWTASPTDSLGNGRLFTSTVVFNKTGISKYALLIQAKEADSTHAAEPFKAQVITDGVSIGSTFEPYNISIEKADERGAYKYVVDATIEWTLVGTPFSLFQNKSYSGTFTLK